MRKVFLLAIVFMSLPGAVLAHVEDESYGHMMNWQWGGTGMIGGGVFGILVLLTWMVWLVVGLLAIVWLWQKINKK